MNEQERNDVIASHEDDALNKYLDDREEDDSLCYKCHKGEVYIEFNDEYLCQDCYEDACAYAEYLADLQEDR